MKVLQRSQWLFIVTFFALSCQEETFDFQQDTFDSDMDAATALAEEYVRSERGRFEDSKRSITVLKYHKGKLLFNTNTDDYRGYQEVEETSVTAIVEPGELIFWFSGGGLEEVDAIEFDGESQEILDDLPEDFVPHKMWVVKVPDRSTIEGSMLKYDIVYQPKGGIEVRLDPKIQIHN